MPRRLQNIREYCLLLFIVVLPFHALLVTVWTKIIAGPEQAPLSVLALWKEGVLGVVVLLACIEIASRMVRVTLSTVEGSTRIARSASSGLSMTRAVLSQIDTLDFLIIVLVLLSLPVTALGHNDWTLYLFGFKYDFVPLLAFLVLRRVSWSAQFGRRLMQVLIFVGLIAAVYGIASFFLPAGFFQWLGYSDLHSIYRPDSPLPAFQQIGGTGIRRIQGLFSGPNQFGIWLIIPWSILFVSLLRRTLLTKLHLLRKELPWGTTTGFLLIAVAIVLTFSRAAWVAAFVIMFVSLWMTLPRMAARRAMLSLFILVVSVGVVLSILKPEILLRAASSQGHIDRPLAAVQAMVRKPIGYGLGAAGPASNRVSDACVYVEEEDDTSWALDRPDLCVFKGSTQVQPSDRACACPFLPENWYLQIGVELGIAGMILFLAFVLLMLRGLKAHPEAFLAFLGISVAALFLHAWEDSAVAYTAWVLMASVLPPKKST